MVYHCEIGIDGWVKNLSILGRKWKSAGNRIADSQEACWLQNRTYLCLPHYILVLTVFNEMKDSPLMISIDILRFNLWVFTAAKGFLLQNLLLICFSGSFVKQEDIHNNVKLGWFGRENQMVERPTFLNSMSNPNNGKRKWLQNLIRMTKGFLFFLCILAKMPYSEISSKIRGTSQIYVPYFVWRNQ